MIWWHGETWSQTLSFNRWSVIIVLYSASLRDLILMWMPLRERRISRGINLGFKAGSSISWYFLSVRAVTTLISFMAKVWPMQFLRRKVHVTVSATWRWKVACCWKGSEYLGPAENGTNACGDLLEMFSGRKRSGSKTCRETNVWCSLIRQLTKPTCASKFC